MASIFFDWKKLLRVARPEGSALGARPAGGTVSIDRRHVYILPTRHGWLFALILFSMLLGSINYSLSLGFVVTFLLAGLGVVGMLHTWRNLAHVSLTGGRLGPVFAGEQANWEVLLADADGRPRYAIVLDHGPGKDHKNIACADIAASCCQSVVLHFPALRRGWLQPGQLTVSTEFPLGLFHAWSHVELEARCLVYPRPAPAGLPLPANAGGAADGGTAGIDGDDDFSGLRAFQHGDSPKRIDWKASAREQGLLTKQFQGMAQQRLWLDWHLTSGDTEQRLSQLTRHLLDASGAGLAYGLRLPQQEIAIGSGELHDRCCLEALALFGLPS